MTNPEIQTPNPDNTGCNPLALIVNALIWLKDTAVDNILHSPEQYN